MFAGLGSALNVEYGAAGAQVLGDRLPEKGQKAQPTHHVHVCRLLTCFPRVLLINICATCSFAVFPFFAPFPSLLLDVLSENYSSPLHGRGASDGGKRRCAVIEEERAPWIAAPRLVTGSR